MLSLTTSSTVMSRRRPAALDLEIDEADVGNACRPGRAEMRVGGGGDFGEVAGRVRRKILGRNPPEQILDELRRHVGRRAVRLRGRDGFGQTIAGLPQVHAPSDGGEGRPGGPCPSGDGEGRPGGAGPATFV